MDSVTEQRGLAGVHLERFLKLIEPKLKSDSEADDGAYTNMIESTSVKEEPFGRPSMETGFHALLPEKWVLHFHSLAAVLMAHEYQKDPEGVARWLLGLGAPEVVFVEPLMPGLLLCREVSRHPQIPVFVLQNHGIILQGSDPKSVLEEWERLEVKFCAKWYPSVRRGNRSFGVGTIPLKIYFPDSAVFFERMQRLAKNPTLQDQDASELWEATALLHSCCPELPELPLSLSAQVSNLPSELYRQQVGGEV